MEEHVWPLPEVDKVLRDNFVLISLYVDDKKELPEFEQLYVKRTSGVGTRKLENYGHKWAHFQASYFGVNSQPFYLICLLYTSPSPRDATLSRMPSSA